jgi:hypothetical protein
MIKFNATGKVDYLKEGKRKYYYIQADVIDWDIWPFPSDAFPIYRGKSRNKKFKQGDIVSFQAVEINGELRAWKITMISSDDE